jgi:DNA (cytosine-5)-methyltransferase 1
MGFDQPGRKPMVIPVSDTQAYRQFGNSVVVPVVEAVARQMIPRLLTPDLFPPVDAVQTELELMAVA